jgi:hypothetical protein
MQDQCVCMLLHRHGTYVRTYCLYVHTYVCIVMDVLYFWFWYVCIYVLLLLDMFWWLYCVHSSSRILLWAVCIVLCGIYVFGLCIQSRCYSMSWCVFGMWVSLWMVYMYVLRIYVCTCGISCLRMLKMILKEWSLWCYTLCERASYHAHSWI